MAHNSGAYPAHAEHSNALIKFNEDGSIVLTIFPAPMGTGSLGTLSQIAAEYAVTTGDVLERRVAGVLGSGLPAPGVLPLLSENAPPRGRAGQVFRQVGAEDLPTRGAPSSTWYRLPVADGIELHVRGDHPVANNGTLPPDAAEAVRLALHRVSLAHRESRSERGPPDRADSGT